MATSDFQALWKMVEEASGGSRELDRRLMTSIGGWHRVEPRHAKNKHGAFIAPEDWLGANPDGSPRLDSLHGTTLHRDVPAVSSSLDAALAFVERDGWEVTSITTDDGGYGARVWKRWTSAFAYGLSPANRALAVIDAYLTALDKEQNDADR